MKIVLVAWKATKEEFELANAIGNYITSQIEESSVTCIDAYEHMLLKGEYYICFGEQASHQIFSEFSLANIKIYEQETLKEITKNKYLFFEKLKEIIRDIKEFKPEHIHIVTKENISIGKELCDISITEQEVEYLKNLRSLLDGSKIVIQKGDIRIEIE